MTRIERRARRLSAGQLSVLARSEQPVHVPLPKPRAGGLPPPDSFTIKFTVNADQAAGIMDTAQRLGARPYYIQLGCHDCLFDSEPDADPFEIIPKHPVASPPSQSDADPVGGVQPRPGHQSQDAA